MIGLFVALSVVLVSPGIRAAGVPRGLDPELIPRYAPDSTGTFTCLDGLKRIPFSRINDDYCDCSDGSDEPGTAACYHGSFYCKNKGHEAVKLSSSFVDDGICDCCDGSDELSGCTNTCLEKSSVQRQAMRASVSQFQSALTTKAERIRAAQSRKEKLLQRAGSIAGEVQQQQLHLQELKDERARLQADADAAAAQAEAERAAQAAADAEAAAAAQAAEAQDAAAAAALATQEATQEAAEAPPTPSAGRAEEPHAETAEEIGRRIASQWTSDPDAAISHNAEAEEMIHEEEEMEPLDDSDQSEFTGDEHDTESYETHDEEPELDIEHPHGYDSHHHHHHGEDHNPASPLNLAASKVTEAEQHLKQLQKEAVDAQKLSTTNYDFGPNDQFLPLFGRTIVAHQTRWTYDVAFFESAHQREGAGNKVLIGQWRGWEANYSEAVFDNGDFCGAISAPRTFRVHLKCGLTEAFTDVEEPSTCAYTSTFTSPLLCSETDVAAVQAQLAALEALEAEVLSEINAGGSAAAVKDEL